MIVIKFGGSSLKTVRKIDHCIGIVKAALPRRPVVVVSAHGGTTDRLIQAAKEALAGKVDLDRITEFHLILLDSLRLERSLVKDLLDGLETILRGVSLVRELTPKTMDHVVSFGERISARIMAAALTSRGVPAQPVNAYEIGFVTDSNHGRAAPLPGIEEEIARSLGSLNKVPVVTGFIGRDDLGNITTIGRNGSDYTAAIIGAAVEAEEIQIWTDVDGVMTADPSLGLKVHNLPLLSFGEASELSYYGAEVLHTGTLIPAIRKNIPIRVANTEKPDQPGTRIVTQAAPGDKLAKSIVYKEDVCLINVVSPRLMSASLLLSYALERLTRLGIGVHIAATSVSSVSFVTDGNYPDGLLQKAVEELKELWSVSLERDKAIVCVVGEELRAGAGSLGRIFTVLGEQGVKARLVSQSASELNVAFLVDNSEIKPAVTALHDLLLNDLKQ